MKKYIKPEVTFFLLLEDSALCGASTIDHSASHGSGDAYGNPNYINEGQQGQSDPNGTYPVEDDEEGDWDSMSKKQSIWDAW